MDSENFMEYELLKSLILFLSNEIGMEPSSIDLGIRLSLRDNIPLPISLWNYGMLSIEELDKIYGYLFQNKH